MSRYVRDRDRYEKSKWFNDWHRAQPDDTAGLIDLDGCGYCHRCKYPLYLVEATESVRKKNADVTENLGHLAGLEVFVFYRAKHRPDMFCVDHRSAGKHLGWITQEQAWEVLVSIRRTHICHLFLTEGTPGMAILDLQRRITEAGRIRIGQQVPTGGGKTRPEKLDTFRLTSPDKRRIGQAAQLYGGTPTQWTAPAGKQWELVTTVDALDILVPPSDMAFSQHYELWSGGGCQRRCDGRTEVITDGPCLCDPEARECTIHTRLSVMLADLPGIGLWRIDTQGYYAAVELQGAVEVLAMAAAKGHLLPARLRLEQRMVKRPGQQTRRFAVPVLDVEISPAQLLGGQAPRIEASESPPAITDGSAPLTPVPETVRELPVATVAEQATAAPKTRRRTTPPIPSTGIEPRTMQQVAEHEHLITQNQLKKLHAGLGDIGLGTDRDNALAWLSNVLERADDDLLTTSKGIRSAEVQRVFDAIEEAQQPNDGKEAVPDATD